MKVKVSKQVEEMVEINPPCYFQKNDHPVTTYIKVYLKDGKLYYDEIMVGKNSRMFADGISFDAISENIISITKAIWEKELGKYLDYMIKYCEG